mgnify:CR=1 FL=1
MPNKTYTDKKIDNNTFYRTINSTVDDEELVWHRDITDREVHVIDGYGWKIQYENKLPIEISSGDVLHINKMDYHRLIKGETGLVLKIREK